MLTPFQRITCIALAFAFSSALRLFPSTTRYLAPLTFENNPGILQTKLKCNKIDGLTFSDAHLSKIMASAFGCFLLASSQFLNPAIAAETQMQGQKFDGFAEYAAKGNKMDQSDVGCFAKECGAQTKACFTDGSCLKGVTCLGRCKGEQESACATRCFAQFGGPKLDSWLSCTLEDHECVKIPKDMDFSSIDKNPPLFLKDFDSKMLEGTWYKVLGLNPKYDLFDCQKNTFNFLSSDSGSESAQLGVEFRLKKPDSVGGGFWQNKLSEQLEIDPPRSQRSFHTEGHMFGLTFRENWYVSAASNKPNQEYVFVRYRGHTLQGTYEGGFVYSRTPELSKEALIAIRSGVKNAGLEFESLLPIDNSCPSEGALPTANQASNMGIIERIRYEFGFLYDLLEWVKPGTINKYQ